MAPIPCPSPTGLWFFTLCLAQRGSTLLCDEIDLLRWAWITTARRRPFTTIEAVVLPDHLHCIWQVQGGDRDVAARWQAIRAIFARHANWAGAVPAGRGKGLWQPRYWQHAIRDAEDLQRHRQFCQSDPARHGLVRAGEVWPYCSQSKRAAGMGAVTAPPKRQKALPRLLHAYGEAAQPAGLQP